jgi:hypothetical protein
VTRRSAQGRGGLIARSKRWGRELAALPPGERFLSLHDRRAQRAESLWRRVAGVSAGILLIAAGLFQLVVPGPGILVMILGAALLAREFASVARWMDSAELWCRRVARRRGGTARR